MRLSLPWPIKRFFGSLNQAGVFITAATDLVTTRAGSCIGKTTTPTTQETSDFGAPVINHMPTHRSRAAEPCRPATSIPGS